MKNTRSTSPEGLKHPEWFNELKESVFSDAIAQEEYERFRVEFELAEKLKQLREMLHMSQQTVADKMATTASAIARLESTRGTTKHSPSVQTLVKYAHALGYRLNIEFVPESPRP